MAATGAAYEDVLRQAQQLGYAEADPTEDVNGADAAAKMAILARLAFHTPVTLEEVRFEGIEAVQPDDLAYAKELGLSLKLLRYVNSAFLALPRTVSSVREALTLLGALAIGAGAIV